MAENAANVVAIELIAAAQGCDFHAPLRSSAPLERVRTRLRECVPRLDRDRSRFDQLLRRVKSDAYDPVYNVQSLVSTWIGDTLRSTLLDRSRG